MKDMTFKFEGNLLVPMPELFKNSPDIGIQWVTDMTSEDNRVHVIAVNSPDKKGIGAAIQKDHDALVKAIETAKPEEKKSLDQQLAFVSGVQEMMGQAVYVKTADEGLLKAVSSELRQNSLTNENVTYLSGISAMFPRM